ncbi:MAG: transporter substrate-binding domain-containing protein [Anaerovoracaceae bacterium]
MKNFKKVMAVAMALVMVFAFAACGGTSAQGSAAEGSGTDTVVYKVGTEPTFPPFDTTDDAGNIVGFDMDLVTAIGEDQGFEVEFVNLQFDSLIPALQSGQIDLIAAGMNCEDEERQEQVDFGTPYYDSGLVVAVKADNTTINSVDDLTPDMKVAAQIGTTGADKATALADEGKIAEAVILNGLDTAMMQLINGDVAAVINDQPVTKAYIAKQPDQIKIVGDVMNAESYAIAVQKGNTELLEKINTGMQNLQDNGKFDEIFAKWFES